MIFSNREAFDKEVDKHRSQGHTLEPVTDSDSFLAGVECKECDKKIWMNQIKDTKPIKNLDQEDDDDDEENQNTDQQKTTDEDPEIIL